MEFRLLQPLRLLSPAIIPQETTKGQPIKNNRFYALKQTEMPNFVMQQTLDF